jgi:hypothetical protein
MNDTLPFRLVAAYDRMRLATYREHGSRISIGSARDSLLLRFDDVGYFNAVYGYDADLVDRLDALEHFFHGSPHGCRLMTPTLSSTSPLARACAARGWVPDLEYAWLTADPLPLSLSPAGRFEIRAPGVDEQDLFFRTYLTAFDADHDRIPAVIENMRHLFSNPHLHFLFACENDRPVGVGMLHQSGNSALLCAGATLSSSRGVMVGRSARSAVADCAGATLSSSRGVGGHETLLTARIQLARSLGCTSIHSWAASGGHSHTNLEQAGLRTVRTTLTLRLPPDRLA